MDIIILLHALMDFRQENIVILSFPDPNFFMQIVFLTEALLILALLSVLICQYPLRLLQFTIPME